MCTNMQRVCRYVNHKGEPASDWKFAGPLTSTFSNRRSKKIEYTKEELEILSDFIKKGVLLPVPCGSCLECRVVSRREMAAVLMCEARYWKEASFVTLTYSPEHMPTNGSVNNIDPAMFVERLRAQICRDAGCRVKKSCTGICPKIKTFGCREYGPKLQRPHYHLIIFGYQFDDLSHPRQRKNDFSKKTWITYRSKKCAELWGKGFVEIGNCEPAAAEYICGYTIKKLKGKKSNIYGEKMPEGIVCRSRGIGTRYLQEFSDFILRNGQIRFRRTSIPIPRKFRKRLRELHPEDYKKMIERLTKDFNVASLLKKVSPLRATARDEITKAKLSFEKGEYEHATS